MDEPIDQDDPEVAEPTPPLRSAPPTEPVWVHTAPPPKWPLVIGIISMVYGGGSLGMWAIGMVMWLAFRKVPLPTAPGAGAGTMQLFTGPLWWVEVLTTVLTVATAIVALVAGVKTFQRRPSGRTLHLWFAIVYLALLASNLGLTLVGMNPALARMPRSPMGGSFLLANLILGFAVSAAYPVFALVWFVPRRRSPDHGATGGPGPGWVATGGGWLPERPRA